MDDDAFQNVTDEGDLDGYGVEDAEETDDLFASDDAFEDSDPVFGDELDEL